MKRSLKDILSISRPQRIGLWCILLCVLGVLIVRYCGNNSTLPINYSGAIDSFKSELDSCKIDTIKMRKARKHKKKKNNTKKEDNNYNKNESLPRIED